jgi:hypothetical protein
MAAYDRVWPLTPLRHPPYRSYDMASKNLNDYDQIAATMQLYIDGCQQGKSEIMRPAFHPDASFFGYAGGQLYKGTQSLFDWVDGNGPAPEMQARIVSIDIAESIAVVRLECAGWSGNLAGSGVSMSDLFTLLKQENGWIIIQKAFHWHS